MDPSTTFYQTLSSVSFTLLGVWFAVIKFGHGGWLTDPTRHRSTLHVTAHFLLPGTLGLSSLLSVPGDGGLVWRSTFIVGGVVGAAEAFGFLRAPDGPVGGPQRALRALDPLLYLALVGTAFIAPRSLPLTPQQAGGIVNGLIFLVGLGYVWLAFAEWAPEEDAEPSHDRVDRVSGSAVSPAAGPGGGSDDHPVRV
jgi:hypothetical protein